MPIAMDTQQQNFWVENIQKEAALRFAWQLKYSKQFAKDISVMKKQQQKSSSIAGKTFKENIADNISKIENEMLKTKTTNKDRKSRPTSLQQGKKIPFRDMRPPTVNTKSLLYNGISAHGEGRHAYLKKRKLLTPEQKFEFPVLSSCQYGWKIQDFVKDPKGSAFARTCVIRDTFYINSGIRFG